VRTDDRLNHGNVKRNLYICCADSVHVEGRNLGLRVSSVDLRSLSTIHVNSADRNLNLGRDDPVHVSGRTLNLLGKSTDGSLNRIHVGRSLNIGRDGSVNASGRTLHLISKSTGSLKPGGICCNLNIVRADSIDV
jgi:hypothetical protein